MKRLTTAANISAGTALAAPARASLLGIVCVFGAMLSFSTQDVTFKWLSGDYPLHQITLTRAVVAMTIILALFVPFEGGYRNLRTKRLPLHLLRGLSVVLANMAFFTGLATLPLGQATAIFFVAPLLITSLSVVLLGEVVGRRRWIAVSVGLVGVVVMLRPGAAAFQWAALLPLAAALFYALLQIMTRKLGVAEKASAMAFYVQVMFLVVRGAIGLSVGHGGFAGSGSANLEFLLRAWVVPAPADGLIMVATGGLGAVGAYLISQAYRVSQAALIAPFEYIALPLSILWGVVFFGDWPDTLAWLGTALIAGAGLYVFYRETIGGRTNRRPRVLPRNR